MRIHLLVLDGVFDLGLAALTDTLSTANALAGSLEQPPAPIEVTLVGVRRVDLHRRLGLLGAVLAPTDPVLAGDVQVGPPTEGGEHPVRFVRLADHEFFQVLRNKLGWGSKLY